MKKAVLSLSGGLDSTCLLLNLLSLGYEVKCYSFNYGQRHLIELKKAQKNLEFLKSRGIEVFYQVIDLKDVFNESTSSLQPLSGVDVPEGHYEGETMKMTVVENRNTIFSSILYGKALSWANRTGEEVEIFLGIHAGDHAIYPDCREESRLAAELTFKISNWGSEKVSYKSPFVNLSKGGVLQVGLSSMSNLGLSIFDKRFILRNTNTCYNPNSEGYACGKCGSCVERLEAFKFNDLEDPIKYR